jgi:hypothetical protein
MYILSSRGALFSIAVDEPDAELVPVSEFQSKHRYYRTISPDGSLIAAYVNGEVRVLSFPDGHEVARWAMPWPLLEWATFLRWHPDGKTLILNSTSYYNQMGMCLFDVEKKEMFHVFNVTRPWCRTMWSPDCSQLIVDPYSMEPWLLEIDPNRPLEEVLAPALGTKEFLTMLMKRWNERIKVDPQDTELYVSRAVVRMATKDYDGAQQDLKQCVTLINEPNDPAVHAIDHWAQSYLRCGRLIGAELWALARAQIIEKFPAHTNKLYLQEHPYQQLIQIYDGKGEKQKQIEWQKRWQEIQGREHTLTHK